MSCRGCLCVSRVCVRVCVRVGRGRSCFDSSFLARSRWRPWCWGTGCTRGRSWKCLWYVVHLICACRIACVLQVLRVLPCRRGRVLVGRHGSCSAGLALLLPYRPCAVSLCGMKCGVTVRLADGGASASACFRVCPLRVLCHSCMCSCACVVLSLPSMCAVIS